MEKRISKEYYYLLQESKRNNKEKPYKIKEQDIKEYLLRWKSEIWPTKSIEGFHPGIYKDRNVA